MSRQPDYLPQLLQDIQERLVRLDNKQDKQLAQLNGIEIQTNRTNGRVTQLEKEMKSLERKKGKTFRMPPLTIMYLLAIAFVILLAIVATAMKINISGLLP